MLENNIIINTDAYKQTHWFQYPPNTEKIFSYLEARNLNQYTVFFGLQYILKKYFDGRVVTNQMINEAYDLCNDVFGYDYFNVAGWEYVIDEYNGYLPIRIKAIPEGSVIPNKNVLMTIENTDDECFWLTNFIESHLLQVWYPTTVATLSYNIRKTLEEDYDYHNPFTLNDFGLRGCSSLESASLGGAAHLLSFNGTDNLPAIKLLQNYYYGKNNLGGSVIASEHSTMTSGGKENECEAFRRIIERAPKDAVVSLVSDSYDIDNAISNIIGKQLKDIIIKREGRIVCRPDSGTPEVQCVNALKLLEKSFGSHIGKDKRKVLNHNVGVIYGDGVNHDSIKTILNAVIDAGYSVENVIFGMGGALLQQCNRDTHGFAIKCSAIKRNGKWHDVYKEPKSFELKKSYAGRLKLIKEDGVYKTVKQYENGKDFLNVVYRDGLMSKEYNVDQIKVNMYGNQI